MSDDRSRPPPIGGFVATHEAAALWRAREEDRVEARDRFTRIEAGVEQLRYDVHEVKGDIRDIKDSEERRTKSAEKRNQRLWQVATAVLVPLLVALIIALFKVFVPIAVTGVQVKPATVNDHVDELQEMIKEHQQHGFK